MFKKIFCAGLCIAVFFTQGCNQAAQSSQKQHLLSDPSLLDSISDKTTHEVLNSPITQKQVAALEDFYQHQLLRTGFNGSILVAKKGVVIFEKYKGIENRRTQAPITPASAFQLASISKTFTAMAVLWLHQEGKLKLEDTIEKYFPDFPYKGINLQMLLSHRSGLPNYLYFSDSLWEDKQKLMTNMDVIRLIIQHRPKMEHLPNTHFQYCNTNYCILAAIVEKVTRQSFSQFMHDTFFVPLGMHSTWIDNGSDTSTLHRTISYDYGFHEEANNNFDGVVGDKGVYSTAQDMLKWDRALYSDKLFAPATLQAAFTPYSHEHPGIRNYGLGWRLLVFPDNLKIVYHNGWWHGNNTVFYRFIKDSTTLIILSNRYNRAVYQAVRPLRRILGEGDESEDLGAD